MGSSEVLSRYSEMELNPLDNLDEVRYRERIQPREKIFYCPQEWIKHMRKDKFKIPAILKENGVKFAGHILEIGAGSCWLSSILSKFSEVEEICALDFSRHVLKIVAPEVMDYLKADAMKIVRVRGSFYDLNRLDRRFDFVVADQTLHHADYPFKLLDDISNVLRSDGRIIFIREPIAPKIPILKSVMKRIFGSHERKYGVTEKTYTLDEWREIFWKGGFDIVCYPLPVSPEKLFFKMLLRARTCASFLSFAHNIIYGIKAMNIAFVGKKRAKELNS